MTINEIVDHITYSERTGDDGTVSVVGNLNIQVEWRSVRFLKPTSEEILHDLKAKVTKEILRQLYDDTSTALMGCIVSLEQCHPNNHETRKRIIDQMKKLARTTPPEGYIPPQL